MRLKDLFTDDAVALNLTAETKDEALEEMIRLLRLEEKSEATLLKTLRRREKLGSTGIGKGIAIPHCRSLVVSQLRLAYGRKPQGLDFKSIDGRPVHHFFMIVAPPLEVSNQYLPVLGKIAQFAKDPEIPDLLMKAETPKDFLSLLASHAP